MTQVFHPVTNTLSKASIFGAGAILIFLAWFALLVVRSPYATQAYVVRAQPVAFSHKHHVDQIGLDCRFCHTSVEESPFAGIPSTQVCMGCHSQVWVDSPMLEPVHESYRLNMPIHWTRVHDLPDFAYFDHSIHVNKGIGCSTCHGRVDQMPLMWRTESLHMEWCLACHRQPERYVRRLDEVFDMHWTPPPDQLERGRELVKQYNIDPPDKLTNCSICHR